MTELELEIEDDIEVEAEDDVEAGLEFVVVVECVVPRTASPTAAMIIITTTTTTATIREIANFLLETGIKMSVSPYNSFKNICNVAPLERAIELPLLD